jgi:hypothetical protein
MPAAPAAAAPPNFYDNMPAGGDAAAGGSGAKKDGDTDADEELMKGLTGVYRVLSKMAKLKKDVPTWKAGIDEIKESVKKLVVQGLKKDPSTLDSGEDKPADYGSDAPPAASGSAAPPPSQTDSTHAA